MTLEAVQVTTMRPDGLVYERDLIMNIVTLEAVQVTTMRPDGLFYDIDLYYYEYCDPVSSTSDSNET